MITESIRIVVVMYELSKIEKTKVNNILMTGNAYAIFLEMDLL